MVRVPLAWMICPTCGENAEDDLAVCPYCEMPLPTHGKRNPTGPIERVNLKRGNPTGDVAADSLDLIIRNVGVRETLFSDELSLSGNRLDAVRFFRLFSPASGGFPIVTP